MEGSRPQKLAKLHDLRRSVPYVSKSALEAILARVAEEGLPERRTTKAMLAAVRAELAHWCAYGELLMTSKVVDLEGMEQDMLHVNFHSLLHGAYKQGGSFTELLNACHNRCPSSLERPWSLCVYTDECWPGNALSAKAQKKSWTCYVSFKQLGSVSLSNENAWLPLFFQKTEAVNALSANMSQCLRKILATRLCVFNNFCCFLSYTSEFTYSLSKP